MRGESVQNQTRRGLAGPSGGDLVWLRPGDERAPLFLFPGGGADAFELDALAQRLKAGRAVACMQLGAAGQGVSIDAMADQALALITEAQPRGPCHLLGYSFGGATAVEVARRLHAAGREVALLVLVEAVYDPRYWPAGVWAATQLRRTMHRLADLKGAPLHTVIADLRRRAGRLFGRTAERFVGGAPVTAAGAAPSTYAGAMARFRPRPYAGPAVFFTAERGDHCSDPPALWRGLVGRLDVERIPGDHLGIVRSQASLECLAAGLDARLGGPAEDSSGPIRRGARGA